MSRKPGRNDPCPCGSGKKYKRCCGAATARAAPQGPPRGVVPRLVGYARSESLQPLYQQADNLYMEPLGEFAPEEREALFEQSPELPETLDIHFHEWLLADYEDPETGTNVIDQYLAHRGWREGAREQAWLRALRANRLSLYEVQAVRAGEGVTLRDVLRGGEPVDVIEHAGSQDLRVWDYLVTRVIPFEGHHYLSGASLPLTREMGQALAEDLPQDAREALGALGDAQWEVFLQAIGPYFMGAYLQPFLTPPAPPELVTSEGDPMCLATQRFTFEPAAREAILARLANRPEIVQDEPGYFAWLDPATQETDWPRVLGTLELEDNRGRLETQSGPRLERGRALLDQLVGDRVHFLPAELQDVRRTAAEAHARPGHEAEALALEPEPRWRALDDHYASWFDEPIPALGDKTPREAVQTEQGRHAVVALLKDYENNEARLFPPDERYEFGWMWEALGLEHPRPSSPPADDDDMEEGVAAHRALVFEVIERQMAMNDPPETRETYDRLLRAGYPHEAAMNLIGCVLANESFEVVRCERSFDRDGYIAALKDLPTLPWDDED